MLAAVTRSHSVLYPVTHVDAYAVASILIVPTHNAVSVSMVLVKPAIPRLAKDVSQNCLSASAALTDMPVHRALWTETVWAIQAGNASGVAVHSVTPLIIRDALVIRLSAPMSMAPCDVLDVVSTAIAAVGSLFV